MVGNHEIYLGDQSIGQAAVTRRGLYYHIACNCRLSGKVIYRVVVNWENKTENIGILAPLDGCFSLSTRIPIKRAGEGQATFRIMPKHEKLEENFIPIRADEPFAYLSTLEKAYLRICGDETGMVIRELPVSDLQGSDPIP